MSIGTAGAIALGVTAAAGVGTAAIGASASKSAAKTQSQAADKSVEEQKREFDLTQANQSPWIQNGQISLSQLMKGLAPGGDLSTPFGGTFQAPQSSNFTAPAPFVAPTLAEAENQPGYKFAREAGDIGIEHGASAAGGVFSTGTLGQEAQFNQGLATTNYNNTLANAQSIYQTNFNNGLTSSQDAYNKALNTFQTQFNTYNTNQSNLYNKLAGTSGLGQTAATQLGTVGASTAANIGNTIQSGAAANAAGTIGAANSITGGLNTGVNGLTNYLSLQQLLKSNSSGVQQPGDYTLSS